LPVASLSIRSLASRWPACLALQPREPDLAQSHMKCRWTKKHLILGTLHDEQQLDSVAGEAHAFPECRHMGARVTLLHRVTGGKRCERELSSEPPRRHTQPRPLRYCWPTARRPKRRRRQRCPEPGLAAKVGSQLPGASSRPGTGARPRPGTPSRRHTPVRRRRWQGGRTTYHHVQRGQYWGGRCLSEAQTSHMSSGAAS